MKMVTNILAWRWCHDAIDLILKADGMEHYIIYAGGDTLVVEFLEEKEAILFRLRYTDDILWEAVRKNKWEMGDDDAFSTVPPKGF